MVLPPTTFVQGSAARQRLTLLHDVCSSPASRELIARLRAMHARAIASGSVVGQAQFVGQAQLVVHGGGGDPLSGPTSQQKETKFSLRAPILAGLGHGAAAVCLAALAGQVRSFPPGKHGVGLDGG